MKKEIKDKALQSKWKLSKTKDKKIADIWTCSSIHVEYTAMGEQQNIKAPIQVIGHIQRDIAEYIVKLHNYRLEEEKSISSWRMDQCSE